MRGDLGQAPGGFPADIQAAVLQGEEPYTDRPNAHLAPVDWEAEAAAFAQTYPEFAGLVSQRSGGFGAGKLKTDTAADVAAFAKSHGGAPSTDLLSHLLYPEVFAEYVGFRREYG